MRLTRASLAALAFLLLPAHAAPAQAAPPGAPGGGCLAEGQVGSYLSKEGSATATFSGEFLDGLRRAGVRFEALDPIVLGDGGRTAWMPIGERYDNIETPSGRVCYPGGFRFTKEATGATYEIDTFWVLFAARGDSKFLATPTFDGGPRPGGELTMVNFSVPQALMPGNFVPHNGGVGPLKVIMSMDPAWVDDLNSELGTTFYDGMHWCDLDIAWRGAPTRPIPSGTSLGMLGLKVMANAIRGGSGLPFPGSGLF
ncbi:MAG: hypothetical protein HOV96_34430 [Nonomuraea sp.]|nr:hypothetical protein [Nonomuraea sp.]NUP61456.1 hypothetical protein [Nonomuraea sp.]NUP82648.1 hypothetical protein [Nonomuraea sp.]NUS03136.1 hypothetical protein [Nonomuraea sp.]NUT09037.1 hypothetical protein [Nonomuraea sp.]